jgi:hypothetical protein
MSALPATVVAESSPPSPGREAYRAAKARLKAAQFVADEEGRPLDRIDRVIETANVREREAAALRDKRKQKVREWVHLPDGEKGEPPAVSPEEQAAERAASEARAHAEIMAEDRDAAVARKQAALGPLKAEQDRCREGLCLAAVDADRDLHRAHTKAVELVVKFDAKRLGLATALNNEALAGRLPLGANSAAQIEELVSRPKRQLVPRDEAGGRRFLFDRLGPDPQAVMDVDDIEATARELLSLIGDIRRAAAANRLGTDLQA